MSSSSSSSSSSSNGNGKGNGNGGGNGEVHEEESVDVDEIIKVLVVGNAKCGKSSIIGQYISKSFDVKYKTTVGADFARKDLYIEKPNNEAIGVRLQLWDIAGQDRFQKLTR
jgi:GTPase SAR1 family protein